MSQRPSKKPVSPKQSPKKILVIEDEGDMCLLLDLLLHEKDTVVDHVKSLSRAKEYLSTSGAGEHDQPAIILLDNRLPDGLGLDFIGYLKELYPRIKIIMISGADAAAKDVAIDNGANGFLSKPFTRAELTESIKDLLN